MATILDAAVGALAGELLTTVKEMIQKAVKFRSTLLLLESTLTSIEPLARKIDDVNRILGRSAEETQKLVDLMENGKMLVLECSEVAWWNCFRKADYQEELQDLDNSICRFFALEGQGLILRSVLIMEARLTDIPARRNDFGDYYFPPNLPDFTVGLDAHLSELKSKLLNDHPQGSVLTVTGAGGLGKTTLAQKLCWDEDVIGKFSENIFFCTFDRTLKLITIVQRLFQRNGFGILEFTSDDDAAQHLEILLRKIGKNPILLVLDDVWPESLFLVDKFVFHIRNYVILITSRVQIREFSPACVLEPLEKDDAMELFRRSINSQNQSRSHNISNDVVEEIVRGCSGFPLALKTIGSNLKGQEPLVWHNIAKKLSTGQSILDYTKNDSSNSVHNILQKSFEVLDPKVAECFKDLGLFPEAQRIRAGSLIDIWAELPDEDDTSAMIKINELLYRNMADIVVTRNSTGDTYDYIYHYVTQHGLLRELIIHQTNQDPPENRNRLIIDVSHCGNNLPQWWTSQNEFPIAAHTLSISTDEAFTSQWCNLQPTKVEVLVLNLRQKKHTLPSFMKKMNKLKVLIITNYDVCRTELENFELLDDLSDLKRIRLEKVSIPFLSNTGVQLKNLRKFSFFMCNVNEAFKNNTTQVSDVFLNLEEMNIDYCDMMELPIGLTDIVSLKKLSITNCHNLSAHSEDIGNLVNLETLRLTSCSRLEELPDSITSLHKLKFLDISDCVSLSNLPENMGKLCSLESLNCKGCTRLTDLPYSIRELGGLRDVVCDEETSALWEPFTAMLSDLKLMVDQVNLDLNWLRLHS